MKKELRRQVREQLRRKGEKVKEFDIEKAIKDIKTRGFRPWLVEKLTISFEQARSGKLKTHDEHAFELNWMENIETLADSIQQEMYKPSPSMAFVIFRPMVREIFAAPFRDRVVQHMLYEMQSGWWDKRMIYDSYSCRKGKGTLQGAWRMQRMMRQATQGGALKAYIIKLDIKGYFMSLSRKKLFAQVKWGLDRQFSPYLQDPVGYRLYKLCEFLWRQVIFDDPVSKAWKRGDLKNWDPDILPPSKSLFAQLPGFGIVIGNLTSQLVSNIFLNLLDHYIKDVLGYKYYGRYVDDFFLIVAEDQYEQAKKDIAKIEKFLREELGLTLHKKKRYIQEVDKGAEFLGVRVSPHCLFPSDRLQKNFCRMANDLRHKRGKKESLISYLGIMTHLDAEHFISKNLWGIDFSGSGFSSVKKRFGDL